MLTRLTPDQISKFWDVISYAINQSLPPTVGENPDKMNRILSAALCGKVDVWASYTKGETNKFEGIVVTKVIYDDAADTRNLLIYCLYGYEEVSKDSWTGGVRTLAKFAKAMNCQQVVAYTNSPYIAKVAKMLGGEAEYVFLSFEVNEIIKKFNDLNGGL